MIICPDNINQQRREGEARKQVIVCNISELSTGLSRDYLVFVENLYAKFLLYQIVCKFLR